MNIFLKILILIIAIAIFALLIFYPLDFVFSPASLKKAENQVCFNPPTGGCFLVELVKTDLERTQGLMFRTELKKNKGMLFIFEKEGIYPFWMKNTLIPLDIIWINKDKKVVFTSENTQPCKQYPCPVITPDAAASYVLEINAGLFKELGMRAGDEINFEISN